MTTELAEKFIGSTVASVALVGGGNTSSSYKVECNPAIYFLKVKELDSCPGLFEKEASGLDTLRNHSKFIVPTVLKKGILGTKQFIVLSWLSEIAGPSWAEAGALLARMHQTPQPFFGFTENNFLGSLPQDNSQLSSWADFYTNCRILPFATQLLKNGLLTSYDLSATGKLCNRLNEIFPKENPSLLHGDLWNGNFMFTERGPALFDPAVYYGHREMDIGMTLLFGGFDKEFYDSYNETYPLASGWQERVPYTQLYPLLAHAIIFGEPYIPTVRKILKPFY